MERIDWNDPNVETEKKAKAIRRIKESIWRESFNNLDLKVKSFIYWLAFQNEFLLQEIRTLYEKEIDQLSERKKNREIEEMIFRALIFPDDIQDN